jgi:flavodoxin I
MSKQVLIIYGSTTGMTEMSAKEVLEGMRQGGLVDVESKNVLDTNVKDLYKFNYLVFGCSTWDYGSLQYDFDPFHEEMKDYDFTGKKVAIFGCGDKSYGDTYCLALKIIQNTVEEQGGEIIVENLDIDSDLNDENINRIRNWGEGLAQIILKDNQN